jgi:hypothetical protein
MRRREATTTMDHDTRRFIRETRRETRLLIEQCSWIDEQPPTGDASETRTDEPEAFDNEVEVIMRSSMGGSVNLAFFIPFLWRHRH